MQSRKNRSKNRRKNGDTKSKDGGKQKVPPPKSSKNYFVSSPSSLGLSMVVLLAAVFLSWFWKRQRQGLESPIHSFLATFVCNVDKNGYCHDALVPTRRTHKATRSIRPHETALVVPRKHQIWDLDAMRDDFVQQELMSARHASTHNPLDSGAFLAAYLARRVILSNNETDHMYEYLQILPSYKDLELFHPVLWREPDLADMLGRQSSAFAVCKAYRDMVQSEYRAFCSVSTVFAKSVSIQEYKRMRIHVSSRSFGPGPPGPEESLETISLGEELEDFKTRAGVDLTLGCRAMVPILDMYNHHAHPNVEWRYEADKQAFVVYAASRGIAAGDEVMDSYGKYTDAHLFAKFGFVNGDGSGYTQASIAALHTMLDADIKQFSYLPFEGTMSDNNNKTLARQKRDLVRYLQLDDGYEECIQESIHKDAFKLKRLKLDILALIANNPDRWILHMPPRNSHSLPASSSAIPITTEPPKFDHGNIQFDGTKLISTCRLITLHEDDFDGDAVNVLQEVINSNNSTFVVGRQTDELEVRALACLTRLSGIALSRFKRTVQEEELLLKQHTFQSRNWTAAHVRLGEMQTLEVLHGISISGMQQLSKTLKSSLPTLRKEPCPFEHSKSLLQQTKL